ncbi:Ribonuclease HI [Nostoc flagelliforme CCNUN1]|uniref:Ribonuclease HI n=1 Tax=Nostoc flagelliforme CCNUN1 TaxID=2038116 RepID=A0A2K8T434_9NOSO|nr:Ribonuclease HI [Nostoc flagelliforme CCNUN1]
MYKLIKADLLGHQQLLETEKIKQELSRFVQSEWRDIAIGKTLTFDRAMIIPSKELKNGEICVPWLDEQEKILNFRSPFLNSNGLCVSNNKHVEDCVAPDGKSLQGIIVVNDEDHKRIQARITELEALLVDVDFIDPAETESERQARDYDGDCIGVARASLYPNLTAEAELRNLPQNAYSPTVKLKKQSFYDPTDGTQPPFEKIAIHMSDSISVGIINNQVTALEALESEIEVLKTYGTLEQQSTYLDQVSKRYQSLFEQEHDKKPKPIRAEYKPFMQSVVALAENPNRTPEIIHQAMDVNRLMYREMIGEGCYQNQIAVDLFKSAKKPEMDKIRENSRYLYRDVNYIKDKKSSSVYLRTGITPKGYSPVELLISQTNKYFQESQLESRPIVQFKNLFKGVEFTPQQKFAAVAAKYEFDRKFNAAVRASRRRETESGPSAIVQTDSGRQLEITNLTRYGHPLIWKAQTLNIRLDEIKFTNSERPHKLFWTLDKKTGSRIVCEQNE